MAIHSISNKCLNALCTQFFKAQIIDQDSNFIALVGYFQKSTKGQIFLHFH